MITMKRTDADNTDFKRLDKDLGIYYKKEKSFYGQLNNIDKIKYTFVAYN
jgi:hypothetical protein